MIQLADLRTSILLAKRARYLTTSLWFLLAVIGLALIAAQFSGRQPATVAIDIGLSSIRLFLPILIILLVQELLSREFEYRYFLTSITYPRSRLWLLVGRLTAVLILTYGLLAAMALSLTLASNHIASGYTQASPVDTGLTYWVTIGFIAVDLFVLTALAVLLSVIASTPSFVLIATIGFMVIARSYSNVIALLERNRFVVDNPDVYKESLSFLHFLLPDLGALDVRMISLYGKMDLLPTNWLASVAANLGYAFFLLALAFFFLNRKQFS